MMRSAAAPQAVNTPEIGKTGSLEGLGCFRSFGFSREISQSSRSGCAVGENIVAVESMKFSGAVKETGAIPKHTAALPQLDGPEYRA